MKKLWLLIVLFLGCLTACSSDKNNLDIRWTQISVGLGDYAYFVYLDNYEEETINIPRYFDDKEHGKHEIEYIHYIGPKLKRLEVKYAKFLRLAYGIEENNGQNLEYLYLGENVDFIIGLQYLLNLKDIEVDPNHKSFKSVDGVLYNNEGKYLFQYPAGRKEKEFTISDDVLMVLYDSFANSSIETVYVGKNVEIIESSAFYKSNLKNIYIPKSVKKIGAITVEGYNLFYEGTEEEFNQIDFIMHNNINVTFNVNW